MTLIVRRALLSVSDKAGIVELGQALAASGVEILSTGGTFAALQKAGIPVVEVSAHTGFPEMMDGRVKTLHPRIHGGILARRGLDDTAMANNDIAPIDLVAVNLYPFAQTIVLPDCTEALAIENIDIGGPSMVRAGAKNHADVLTVVNPEDYSRVIDALHSGSIDAAMRREFAVKAFRHTAQYDATVAAYLGRDEVMPDTLTLTYDKALALRYGENPHQRAALYRETGPAPSASITGCAQLQGKALSFNNIADADAALECVKVFSEPACVIVKHANPCGVAVASDLNAAYSMAFATDPTSAFGGIIAFNRPLDGPLLERILGQQFVEVIIAPAYSDAALSVAKSKQNVRLLDCGPINVGQRGLELKRVGGGVLIQDADERCLDNDALRTVTKREPSAAEMADLEFAWKVAWFTKSNAIIYARAMQTVGIGAGQMSRIVSAKIAGIKAADEGLEVAGAVMASDAFFPFRDGIDAAAQAGIRAVIQPGGSVRDQEVIDAANEHGMAMVLTGIRHFRH